MTDPLLRFRPAFPILGRTTYLVSHSLGAMPGTVPERLAAYAEAWGERGVRAWAEGWWEMPLSVGDQIAPLIGARAGEVAMLPNVSAAQAAVISALDYPRARDTIVTTALDFPSVRYVYQALGQRLGARIVEVASDDGVGIDQDRLLAAIDERTRLVAISHVLFRSAYVMNAAAICAHAHRMGALVMLDAYHAVGTVPVDVAHDGADFLTGGVLKWLCGGPGGAFLYASPRMDERFAPAVTGWQAHARPFAFEMEMAHAPGAARWLGGTPPIPALYAATEGVRLVREAGIAAIREKSMRQTARVMALAVERGYRARTPSDPGRRGGTVSLEVPHGDEVAQALLDRDILVDYRPEAGIRVAPHFYTTDDELEHALATIADVVESGSWERYARRRHAVT